MTLDNDIPPVGEPCTCPACGQQFIRSTTNEEIERLAADAGLTGRRYRLVVVCVACYRKTEEAVQTIKRHITDETARRN